MNREEWNEADCRTIGWIFGGMAAAVEVLYLLGFLH